MIVISVIFNVITIYNVVGIFHFIYLFFNLEDSGLSHRSTWGLQRAYITETKVLGAEHDPMLYPVLPYATARDSHATISACSAFMD